MGLEARRGDPSSERLYAAVVPNFEVLKQRKIVNAKEVIRFDIEGLSAKLPSTKRIGSYEIWQEELPRTTTRKLKRFEIQKLCASATGKEVWRFGDACGEAAVGRGDGMAGEARGTTGTEGDSRGGAERARRFAPVAQPGA